MTKRFGRIAGCSLIICWSLIGRADRYEELEIEALTGSQHKKVTGAELSRRLELIESLREHQEACDWQLKSKRLPYSCYDIVMLAAKLKIKLAQPRANLDLKCEKIARETAEIDLQKPNKLPLPCLRVAADRIKVNRYKLGRDFD